MKANNMTSSNEDCSEHLLSDAKEGAWVQVTKSHIYFYGEYGDQEYEVNVGDILIFMGGESMMPNLECNCWSYTFDFFHSEHGKIQLYWDMNYHHERDLDTFLKVIPTRNPDQLELFKEKDDNSATSR